MWRPTTDWNKCPCDDCSAEHKLVDEYGYFCDLSCGKRTAWINKEIGADAMLTTLDKYEVGRVENGRVIPITYDWGNKCGRIVFIPDEE
jgi:hypothetical protein